MATAIQTTYKNGHIIAKTLAAVDDKGTIARLRIPYDHSLGAEGSHVDAARQLAVKLLWQGTWTSGGTDTGYVFVRGSINGAGGFIVY